MRYRIALTLLALVLMKPVAAQTCPAGNPLVAPDSRYQVSEPVTGERVVEDLRTGLIWKQCAQGRSGAGCATGADSTLTWTQALVAASSETFAGHSDWRLPTVNELRSLVESGCHNPAINTTAFPATASTYFWSSSTRASDASVAWIVTFLDGILFIDDKVDVRLVRLVRGGQSLDPFNAALSFTPDPFSFTTQVDVPLNDERISNAVTLGGLTTVTGIQVAGEPGSEYRINGGAWTSALGTVVNGDTVEVRHTSAAAPASQVTSALTIGAVAATFSSSTAGYSPPQRNLNDTAQITCHHVSASTGTVAPATPNPTAPGFEGQDCVRGAAAADALGVMVKAGASDAPGRDYSKIANDGSELPASATLGSGPDDWACTRDNLTGLVWEVKVNDAANLRHFNHAYIWFDNDNSVNGAIPGALGSAASCSSTLTNCNTTAFRDAVNALPGGLCAASDWRLPTPQELQSLKHAGLPSSPMIDVTWFPNTATSYHWSSISYAPNAVAAWSVNFGDGNFSVTGAVNKLVPRSVRLVRGGQ